MAEPIRKGEGKWLVRVFLGRDENGRRRFHNKTIRGTKKDAERYRTKVERARDLGESIEPTRETVGAFLDRWLESAAKPRVRARTYRDYKGIVDRYLRPALGAVPLGRLSPMEIQAYYVAMMAPAPEGMGLSSRTVRYTHAVFRSALSQAVKWELIPRNPALMVELPRQRRAEMRVLDQEQVRRFLEAARCRPTDPERQKHERDRTGERNRWYALFYLMISTGIRPGEALALRWTDVDGDRITVRRGVDEDPEQGWVFDDPKSRRGTRSVTLPPTAVQVLEAHRAAQMREKEKAGASYEDQGLVFATAHGTPERRKNIDQRHFKPLLRLAGLPEMRFYDLRHTHATLLLSAGEHVKIVSERLGHASVAFTLDIYSHVLPHMQAGTAEKVEGLLGAAGQGEGAKEESSG
jgi:integrase